jgi:lipopolysaccharide transport system permease protein
MANEVATSDHPSEVSANSSLAADDENWEIVIGPKTSLLSLPFHEVWNYRDLMYLMVRRDIVSFYKQTILGPLWYVVQPLMTTLIYMLVFGHIAGLSTDGIPRFLFYLCGVTFWNYFSECLCKTASVFRDNVNLFGKVYFPRIIAPLSIVVSNLVRFAIQFILFLGVVGYYLWRGEIHFQATIVLFPLLVVLMAVMGLGLGMLLSAMTTKYRDLSFLLQFGVQLFMYATPVIYPFSQIPVSLQALIAWNPLTPIFETARHGFLGGGTFSAPGLMYSATFTFVIFMLSTVIFNRVERTFMDTV